MYKSHLVFGVTYHGSVPEPLSGLDNVHGKHISAVKLREHLKWLREKFTIVGLETMMRDWRAGNPPPRHSLFVVFHDGYRHNYEIAYPILKEFGIKATFFLTTDFISSDKRFWVDLLDAAVKYSKKETVRIDFAQETLDLSDQRKRYETALQLRRILKPLPEDLFETRFTETLTVLGFPAKQDIPKLGEHERCMDWDMVREMAAGGMEFGSHTHHHIICARQDAKTAREEMERSKATIEKETGRNCELFCYPNGSYPRDGNEITDRIAREVGYQHVLYMVGPYNLIHPGTFRLTAIAFGEKSDQRELQRTLSSKRFWARKLRRSPIWPWERDSLD